MVQTATVKSATDFAEAAAAGSKIRVVLVAPETIVAQNGFLDKRWDGVRALTGTVATRHVSASGAYRVKHSWYVGGRFEVYKLLAGKKVAESIDSEDNGDDSIADAVYGNAIGDPVAGPGGVEDVERGSNSVTNSQV